LIYEYYQPPVLTDQDFILLVLGLAELCKEANLHRKMGFYKFIASNLIADKTKDLNRCLDLLKDVAANVYDLPFNMMTYKA